MPRVAIIGGGPAGLMAAEVIARAGIDVALFDAMPSVGRKFLLAGKGGLNLTHSEPRPAFLSRYGARGDRLAALLDDFGPEELRAWADGLGIGTFVGTSGRVFPAGMKAAPLLRAWLHRLRGYGVRIHVRQRWRGWTEGGAPVFDTPQGSREVSVDVTVLALGGASWPQLGSDGAWVDPLQRRGVTIAPLRPANCGFDTEWSEHFRTRFAGHPVKTVAAILPGAGGPERRVRGEFMITGTGVEGGLVYTLSAPLRDTLSVRGEAVLCLDLVPDRDPARVRAELTRPRGSDSMATHLRRRLGIEGVKAGLLRECAPRGHMADMERLAHAIKSLPLRLRAARPVSEAISTAGGIPFEALDERLMIRALPGVFCAGEMLDWEAPTGGYLLSACFATGHAAGRGALAWLTRHSG